MVFKFWISKHLRYNIVLKKNKLSISAASFLHENGVLLHFNDPLRELNTLFFIDPSWLCDMLSLVVAIRERNPYVKKGYMQKSHLMSILMKSPRLPEKFIPQVNISMAHFRRRAETRRAEKI